MHAIMVLKKEHSMTFKMDEFLIIKKLNIPVTAHNVIKTAKSTRTLRLLLTILGKINTITHTIEII